MVPGIITFNDAKRNLKRINATIFKIEEIIVFDERIKTAQRIGTLWGDTMLCIGVDMGSWSFSGWKSDPCVAEGREPYIKFLKKIGREALSHLYSNQGEECLTNYSL